MYCSRCGVPLPEGSAFCPQCGARVAIPAQKVYSSEEVTAQEAAPSEEVSVFDDFTAADEPIAPTAFSADEGTTYAAAPEVVPPVVVPPRVVPQGVVSTEVVSSEVVFSIAVVLTSMRWSFSMFVN